MNQEALKSKIQAIVPEAEFPEGTQFQEAIVPSEKIYALALAMRDDPDTHFDFLFCQSAVDWGTHFFMVYHLSSTTQKHILVLKAKIDDHENPKLDSVSSIWATAEYHEREAYDLMGIHFNNHPDLRRIFLEEDWEGHPLRKDYVDEINIVDL